MEDLEDRDQSMETGHVLTRQARVACPAFLGRNPLQVEHQVDGGPCNDAIHIPSSPTASNSAVKRMHSCLGAKRESSTVNRRRCEHVTARSSIQNGR